MVEAAGAAFGAHDASVAIGGPAPTEDAQAIAQAAVDAARVKVEKQRAHLASAEAALAAALAALEGA